MDYNSKEEFNRTKVKLGTYKETCDKLKEPTYKRGSKGKEEQIKRWEKELSIYKQKDNSFTYINKDFKDKKKIRSESKEKEGTVIIGNHSVFLGQGKYKFDRFNNMRGLFLDFISSSEARTKTGYIKDFYSDCYLSKAIEDVNFKQEVTNSKSKRIALDVFNDECRYVFNQFLKTCKNVLEEFITYYDDENEIIDFVACEVAWKFAVKELDFKYFDYKTRIEELYAKINEILVDSELNPIRRRETKYSVVDECYCKKKGDNCSYITDITNLYEIIKLVVIKKLRKRSVAIGVPRNIIHNLTPAEYKEAKAFIEEYVCYYDIANGAKYYSVEDIPKTGIEEMAI